MSRKNLLNFRFLEIWERIKRETDIVKLGQLAKIIEISQSVVSKRKDENFFPVEWAYIVSKEKNLNIDWILEGTGPIRPGDQEGKKLELDFLNDIEKWIHKNESKREGFTKWFEIEIERNFPEFKEWKRKADKDRENSFIQEANIA